MFFDINALTEVEESDSNDILACVDNAHKVVMCTSSIFSENNIHKPHNETILWILSKIVNLDLIFKDYWDSYS